jgi:hypothetical protein
VPNHVESDLHVHGDPEALKAFMEFAQGPGGSEKEPVNTELLSAHKFIPYPEEYDTDRMECTQCAHQFPRDPGGDSFPNCPECGDSAKDGYNRGGYDWCIEHWGTKWGLYGVFLEDGSPDDEFLEYTFQSAWAPPLPVIEAMSKGFPSLTFALEYFECGAGFMGSVLYVDGQLTEEGEAPYHGPRGG